MQRCFTLLKKRMLFECLAVKEHVSPEIEIFLVESSTATESSDLHSLPVSELPLPLLISSLLCFTFPVSFLTFQNRFPELLGLLLLWFLANFLLTLASLLFLFVFFGRFSWLTSVDGDGHNLLFDINQVWLIGLISVKTRIFITFLFGSVFFLCSSFGITAADDDTEDKYL